MMPGKLPEGYKFSVSHWLALLPPARGQSACNTHPSSLALGLIEASPLGARGTGRCQASCAGLLQNNGITFSLSQGTTRFRGMGIPCVSTSKATLPPHCFSWGSCSCLASLLGLCNVFFPKFAAAWLPGSASALLLVNKLLLPEPLAEFALACPAWHQFSSINHQKSMCRDHGYFAYAKPSVCLP